MTTPYNYQIEGIAKIDEEFDGRALLADSVGLGKTYQALGYAAKYPKRRPVVVVCPAYLKYVWEYEARTHFGWKAKILSSRKPYKGRIFHVHNLYIINYDILPHWVKFLRRIKPKIVIFDEVHYLQGRTTKRTKAARMLCKRAKHVIGLSATPMISRPAELWPFLNILRKDKFKSFMAFATKYCAPKRAPWGWDVRGAANLGKLRKRLLRTCMIRRLTKDVLKDLPKKIRIIVPLKIKNRSEYDEATRDFLEWLRRKSPHKASRAEKAEKLVRIGYLKRLAARLKMKSVYEWIDNFLAQEKGKIILYAFHRKCLEALHRRYQEISVIVDGSIKGNDRKHAIERFKKSQKCRILVGQMRAVGAGWSAKGIGVEAFIEQDFTPGVHTQCEGRIIGLGRGIEGERPRFFYLVARNTIEEILCKLLQKKQKDSDEVLDGERASENFDIHDQLVLELEKGTL